MDINYETSSFDDPTNTILWENDGHLIKLIFEFSVHAYWSKQENLVFVCNYQKNEILTFSKDGIKINDYQIPELKNYKFWKINNSASSKSGISLVYNPIDFEAEGLQPWDMIQYELDINSRNLLGKKIGIYR